MTFDLKKSLKNSDLEKIELDKVLEEEYKKKKEEILKRNQKDLEVRIEEIKNMQEPKRPKFWKMFFLDSNYFTLKVNIAIIVLLFIFSNSKLHLLFGLLGTGGLILNLILFIVNYSDYSMFKSYYDREMNGEGGFEGYKKLLIADAIDYYNNKDITNVYGYFYYCPICASIKEQRNVAISLTEDILKCSHCNDTKRTRSKHLRSY